VSGSTTTYYPFPHYEVSGSAVTKYYFFNGQRVAMRQSGTLYYLHPEHLGGNLFATNTGGAKSSVQGYYAYGKTRWGNLQTDHRFTGQKYDNTGLYYFNARYYDPVIGTFISPDTLVPDPTNVWDYNRFAYARLNPMKFNDPTGYATSKPDWWPDFVPYIFDLPDGMTQAQFVEWLSENNIPTTWGMQLGGSATLGPYGGLTGSVEGVYLFNWWSGEVTLATTTGTGVYVGLPDAGFSLHGGSVFVAGASRIDRSILGLSEFTTMNVEVEALGEGGLGASWSRAVLDRGNNTLWVPGRDFIDPQFDRTVDALAVNATIGVDALSIPLQVPEVPFDVGASHGYAETREVFSFNLYSPFTAVWNWVFGD
jgi:RHS repeat-associated protein